MLEGLRVFDFTATPSAFCGRILADLGADVVRGPRSDDRPPRPPLVGDRSAYALAMNANKRIVDIQQVGLWRVISNADVVITDQGLAYGDVARANRRAILVTITAYGTSGPLAWVPASDIEVAAASGCLWLAGEPGRTPVRTTLPQSPFWTGMYAAMGALVALAARGRTGVGQHVDVSAQAAMTTVHPPAIVFWDTLREEHRRLGPYLIGRSIVGAKFRNIWPCADGHVAFAVQGGPIGRHTGRMLAEWMREKGALDGVVGAIDWDTFDNRLLTQAEVDRLEASIATFLATLTKREFFAGVIARNMLGYPVADARDVFADEQLKAREFWQEIEVAARRMKFPGGFALFDGARPRVTAPLETNDDPQRALATWSKAHAPECTLTPVPPATITSSKAALGDIRVVELGWAAAGPLVGKYLANHGAEVIHLESGTALDAFRSTYPPFKGEPAPDTAAMFAFYNDGKRGVTLNLKHPNAVKLALALIEKADVVIESFPAGTLARRGLTNAAMRAVRKDLIILSSCNQGQTGPHARHPGYGSQLTALAGFNELLGERGRTPVILYGPYIDYIAVGYGVIAVLAALERRRRTGDGCDIDLSQYEAGLQFMAPALLEHSANRTIPTRDGNADPIARPHGVYRCEGDDRWVALSVWSDEEWESFRDAAGHTEWSRGDPALDAAIERWTCERSREYVVRALRARGLRVAPVQTIAELADDPQLRHRGFWRPTAHPVLGRVTAMAPPFTLSDTPAVLERAGPTLGEHNDEVWRGLLGLGESEYRALAAEGVFD
ncbi:MAG TPA: CoA transferase [Candidatus Limnocylindria bacterium]|jgi:crotonobetainyl-CoA:carnitine CoA-transferase CaiB-like acyl-CoA transferase|nr:CoA transferase [Candidatus Limnocylindria bacterium]